MQSLRLVSRRNSAPIESPYIIAYWTNSQNRHDIDYWTEAAAKMRAEYPSIETWELDETDKAALR